MKNVSLLSVFRSTVAVMFTAIVIGLTTPAVAQSGGNNNNNNNNPPVISGGNNNNNNNDNNPPVTAGGGNIVSVPSTLNPKPASTFSMTQWVIGRIIFLYSQK